MKTKYSPKTGLLTLTALLIGIQIIGAAHALSFNFPPSVFNLSAPSSVQAGQLFGISYEYWDDDGLQDVRVHHVLMSDGTHYTQSAGGSGRFYIGNVWSFLTPGNHWIEVYVVDSIGQQSNHIRRNIFVGSSPSPPVVANLSAPSSVLVNERFGIRYTYSDANGLGDVATHHILMSDGSHTTFSAGGSGQFYAGDVWFFSSPGNHWVEVYVVDNSGRQSNHLRRNILVTSPVVLRPDLVVQGMNVSNPNPTPSQTLALSASVLNSGSGSSNSTTLRFYRSDNSTISSSDAPVGTSGVEGLASGGQTGTKQASTNAPAAEGTYWYGACVDAVTNETSTGNNCSPGIQVVVARPPTPDLGVTGFSVDIQQPNPNQSLALSAQVNNSGTGSSNSTILRFYRSDDAVIGTADTPLGTASVESLASGGLSGTKPLTANAPSTVGNYWLGACVDAVNGETNTGNNCSGATQITVVAATIPDLTPTNVAVDRTNPTPSQPMVVSARVDNIGSGTAAASIARFYLSNDASIGTDDTPLGTAAVESLAAGAMSTTKQVNATAPATEGNYWVGVCVDIVTDETQTQNNCSPGVPINVATPPEPDLRVNDLSVDTQSATPNQALSLSARVENIGTGTANGSVLRFYRSTDATIGTADTALGTASVESLATGGVSGDKQLNTTAPADEGNYWFGACVDTVAGEANTGNNCSGGLQVTVARPAVPDLTVANFDVDDAAPSPSQLLSLSARVDNTGTAGANASVLRFYRSTDATIDAGDTPLGTLSVEALDAGVGSTLKVLSANAPDSAGNYWLGACVDIVAGELDTDDNCSTGVPITVLRPESPDLSLASFGVDVLAPTPNQALTLSARVANLGGAAASASILRYYRSTDAAIGPSDTPLGTLAVAALSAGAEGTVQQLNSTAPAAEGDYWLGACVDLVSSESEADNNCSTGVRITVASAALPDLTVSNPSVDDTSPTPGQTLALSARVDNVGSASAGGTVLRFYRSTDATVTTNDTPLGTSPVESLSAGAMSAIKTLTATAPDTEGDYWLGACVDIVTGEFETANNCSPGVPIRVASPAIPDLLVTNLGVDNTRPEPSQVLTLSAQVTNTGSATAPGSVLRFYLSGDSTITTGDTALGTAGVESLPAGGTSAEKRLTAGAPAVTGDYWIGACVDIVTGEAETANNCSAPIPLTVSAAAGAPDLLVPAVGASAATLNVNQSLGLSATVQNAGNAASDASILRFYRSTDALIGADDTFIGSRDVEALPSGGSSSGKQLDTFAPADEGVYWFGACVDGVTLEANRANNCSPATQVFVAGPGTDPTFVAAIGRGIRVAADDRHVALTTLNITGDVIVLIDADTHGTWSGLALGATLGGPKAEDMSDLWFDPKDGVLNVAVPTSSGLMLYRQAADGTWSLTNLTQHLGGGAHPIVRSLTHFITPNLARDFAGNLILDAQGNPVYPIPERERDNVHIAGLTAAGDLVLYYQTRTEDEGPTHWAYHNLTQEDLLPTGQTNPAWVGDIAGYTTPWNGQNLAGLNAAGQILAVWTAPDRNGVWATSNLSRTYGAPPLAGGLSAYVNWGINLTGVLANGHLGVVWWSAQYEQEQRDQGSAHYWAFSDLTPIAGGPTMQADTIANYTTLNWPSNNIVGLSETDRLVVYWWTPDNLVNAGREWLVTDLTPDSSDDLPIGKLSAIATKDNVFSVQGVTADGDVVRYLWTETQAWTVQNVTEAVGR